MTQLSPKQNKARKLIEKRNWIQEEKERLKKKLAQQNRGKKKINGRYYDEYAITDNHHRALELEAQARKEKGGFTAVRQTAKGWVVYVLAS